MTAHDTLHAQLLALLQSQARAPVGNLPSEDVGTMARRLAAFAPWCQAHARGKTWRTAEQASWERVAQALIASAAAQPRVALKFVEPAGENAGRQAGPMLHDVAQLLRADGVSVDEAQELDAAIRWWDGARRAGLPVEADFGECWRALEWMALLQQLLRLAEGGASDAGNTCDAGTEAGLLAAVSKVALRYGPLKPLLRPLPVQPGAGLSVGYTF